MKRRKRRQRSPAPKRALGVVQVPSRFSSVDLNAKRAAKRAAAVSSRDAAAAAHSGKYAQNLGCPGEATLGDWYRWRTIDGAEYGQHMDLSGNWIVAQGVRHAMTYVHNTSGAKERELVNQAELALNGPARELVKHERLATIEANISLQLTVQPDPDDQDTWTSCDAGDDAWDEYEKHDRLAQDALEAGGLALQLAPISSGKFKHGRAGRDAAAQDLKRRQYNHAEYKAGRSDEDVPPPIGRQRLERAMSDLDRLKRDKIDSGAIVDGWHYMNLASKITR